MARLRGGAWLKKHVRWRRQEAGGRLGGSVSQDGKAGWEAEVPSLADENQLQGLEEDV